MQTVSAMEFRRHLGAYLDEVRIKSETIILERAGKPVAILAPVPAENRESAAVRRQLGAVRQLTAIHAGSERAADIDRWLEAERSHWV